jgi:hypothetical protein
MNEEQQIPSYFERMKLIKLGLLPKEAVKKMPKKLKQVSDKKRKEDAEAKGKGGDSELDLFFDAMLKRCTGKCLFCNSKTTAIDPSFYRDDNEKWSQEANDRKHERTIETMKRASIAHLLPKREINKGGFPSVGTNEDNWIELCWQCHHSFDTGKITWIMLKDSKEWDIIKEKLLNVLPVVAMEERSHKLYAKIEALVYDKK